MTVARRRLVDEHVTPWYHCISRAVRRARLCGEDPVSGKDFSHRKTLIEARLRELVEIFAVQCAGFALMDNHLHLLLRLDSRAAAAWSAAEVARRWAMLFTPREVLAPDGSVNAAKLEAWIAARAADPQWIDVHRGRLASLSWFMKCLKEPIARAANREDNCTGAFWEGRFRSVAVLDVAALLATAAYIDLNPVAAGIAKTPEGSRNTTLRARLDHCKQRGQKVLIKDELSTQSSRPELERDLWLLPIEDRRERASHAPHGPDNNDASGNNASETDAVRPGLLEGFTLPCYLRLIDWTSRKFRTGKARVTAEMASIFERLHFDAEAWYSTMSVLLGAKKLVGNFAGRAEKLADLAARAGTHWIKHRGTRRAMLTG